MNGIISQSLNVDFFPPEILQPNKDVAVLKFPRPTSPPYQPPRHPDPKKGPRLFFLTLKFFLDRYKFSQGEKNIQQPMILSLGHTVKAYFCITTKVVKPSLKFVGQVSKLVIPSRKVATLNPQKKTATASSAASFFRRSTNLVVVFFRMTNVQGTSQFLSFHNVSMKNEVLLYPGLIYSKTYV